MRRSSTGALIGPALDELAHDRIVGRLDLRTVPTWRMAPSYSMAIRSPTLKALRMSWVTTSPVTPRSRVRIMSWSMTAEVTGSSPVVGSS